jgi:hypothetical protein
MSTSTLLSNAAAIGNMRSRSGTRLDAPASNEYESRATRLDAPARRHERDDRGQAPGRAGNGPAHRANEGRHALGPDARGVARAGVSAACCRE